MDVNYTPRQILEKLDQYIIGQQEAKRSVAVALRNRYRRMQLDDILKEEIVPKNILMIGPTGVGKTEVARRLAKLVRAPFIKVEATKFTEVGYVGRDVESMVRDLVEVAVHMVKKEKMNEVKDKAEVEAKKKLVALLVPRAKKQNSGMKNPFELSISDPEQTDEEASGQRDDDLRTRRKHVAHQLERAELDDQMVTIEIEETPPSMFDMLQGSGMEQMGMNMQDMLGKVMTRTKKKRKLPVSEAR